MLSIGLTGGIAAGKSLLAARFRELGAVLIDADRLARDVVAPGSAGLAAVVSHFGNGVLRPDGTLDRPKLGAIVFGDAAAREALNGIVHPLVRAAAQTMKEHAGPGDIVVQDIPLLVETGQGANFHLVVVVQAPEEARLARMVHERGMDERDARARLAAQATDAERAAAADVLILNDGPPEQALAQLDELWHTRLLPFAANLASGVPAPRNTSGRRPVPDAMARARISARLAAAVGDAAAGIDRAGTDSVPGGPAGNGPDVLVRLKDPAGVARVLPGLALAGFFAVPGTSPLLLRSADPGQAVNVSLR